MKRRVFIKNGLLGMSAAVLPQLQWSEGSNVEYPFRSLDEAFKAIGFDPYRKNVEYFVVAADVHYGSAGDGMGFIVKEVNLMKPRPAFFCVNGDLIVHGSRSFGTVPDLKERQQAIKEFEAFKVDTDQIDKDIPLKLTLGNHDTHPQEVDPQMFWEVFPGYPPYESFDSGDVHFIFLNGHSTGYIDPLQEAWLRKDVQNIDDDRKTTIIFVHQPSMSHRVRERGIPETISRVFDNYRGPIWLVGGHEHTNGQKVFSLGKTTLIEHHITCGTINIWGGPEKPGYWIYCLQEGRVLGRIFRQRFKGYRCEPYPSLNVLQNVPKPFDNIENILWRVMTGEADAEYVVKAKAADCLNYWAYVKELIYRLPLRNLKGATTRIGLLTDYAKENINIGEQYFLSSDLDKWHEINPNTTADDVLIFEIPEILMPEQSVYFKFTPVGEAAVAGVALLS